MKNNIQCYIEFSSGKKIAVMEYDIYSGIAKDYDGKTYQIEDGKSLCTYKSCVK